MRIRKHIRIALLTILTLFGTAQLMAQSIVSKVGFTYFFDNTEFSTSPYTTDQTMSGVQLLPQLGIAINQQQIIGGISWLKKMGSASTFDNTDLIAYYKYQKRENLFLVGAFPKEQLLDDYDDVFFQDSIHFYRPLLQGLFFQKKQADWTFAAWLDWTGMQTDSIRESFYLGSYGKHTFKRHWYIDYQFVMFHLANNKRLDYGVVDNATAHLSIGYHKASVDNNYTIDLSAGWLTGYENDRRIAQYYIPNGLLLKAKMKYKKMGTENLFYIGEKRMNFYKDYGNQLYWGNPFYQSNTYFQNKIYWHFFETKWVKGEIASKLHISHQKVFFEQLLTLKAKIAIEKTHKTHQHSF